MDPEARQALALHCRQALRPEVQEVTRLAAVVDDLQRRVSMLDELAAKVARVERALGFASDRLTQPERRERVRQLHASFSDAVLARLLEVNRATIERDRRALGLPPAGPDARALNGTAIGRRGFYANGNGAAGAS
jgi:hypothetical protein